MLPILRNVLFIVVVAMAVLMILSHVGVQIGPLIAGAGVVGVAVGFGAQTLVKDIISGVFYLLDDAFRTGEYIQSGNYKGTGHARDQAAPSPRAALHRAIRRTRCDPEHEPRLGDRQVHDRHHLHTISTWRANIKQVGKELSANPEFAPHILEPLKMQGVEEFGDYAIKIRIKLMTKPNEQFVIRRKAYAMIKKAFDDNGIKFATPTVQVAGGDEATAAAARQSLVQAQAASLKVV